MRFEVPQFIEIEDKIIGPLTWKQFIYIAGGVGIIVILFLSSIPFIVFILLALPIGALSFALTFHKINNRPFSIFLESAVKYFTHTRLYLWRRETMQSIIEKPEETEQSTPNLTLVHQQSIHILSRKLELHQSE